MMWQIHSGPAGGDTGELRGGLQVHRLRGKANHLEDNKAFIEINKDLLKKKPY